MKKCSKCKQEKEIKKNGLCKECNTEYMREYRAKNADKIKKYQQEYDSKYYQNNKNKILENKQSFYQENRNDILLERQEYYQGHKEEKQEYNKKYYKENKEQILEQDKLYRAQNVHKIRAYQNKYQKQRRQNSVNFRIRASVSANINLYLKSVGSSKNNISCLDYLGYSIDDLKTHLESKFEPWMTWDNYGKYSQKTWNDNDSSTWTWQIDHIIPQSTFKFTSMSDPKFNKCWALDNLRPYSSKQNVLDGTNRVRH